MLDMKSLRLHVTQPTPMNRARRNSELAFSSPSGMASHFKHLAYTALIFVAAWTGTIAPAQIGQASVSLPGHVPAQVLDGTATRTSHYNSDQKLRIVMSIRPPHMAEEEEFIKEQQIKSSPNFHKFLTAEEWNSRFAPSVEDEQKVVDWAQSQGLTVTRRFSHRLIVDMEGTVDNIEKAFGVTIDNYQFGDEVDFSNDRNPLLPASLSNIVTTVQGMNNIQREHGSAPGSEHVKGPDYAPGPAFSSGNNINKDGDPTQLPGHSNLAGNSALSLEPNSNAPTTNGNSVPSLNPNGFMDPVNLFSSEAYNYDGLQALSHCCNVHNDSTGSPAVSSIAIAGFQNFLESDIAGFQKTYPYLAYNLTWYDVDGTPTCSKSTISPPCATGETTEDIEWTIATSNSFGSANATSHVYAYLGGNFNLSTFTAIYSAILDDNKTRVMTTSWSCTENYDCSYDDGTISLGQSTTGDTSVIGSRHAIFNQMVGMGWTLIAASGDRGASDDCQNGNTNNSNKYIDPTAHTSVAYPASDSDFVAAGGTQISMNGNGTWAAERAWQGGFGAGSCQGNGGGSGGGVSIYFDQPYWQSPLSKLGSKRLSPDISLNALGQGQNLYINGGLNGDANGTSVVAPELAGFFAQENTYLNSIGNICGKDGNQACTPVGLPNWEIYDAAIDGAPHDPFYNMLSGCNSNDATQQDGLKYFCAGPGFSLDISGRGTQYDLVSGWGSVNMMQLAWAINWELLPAYGNPSISFSGPATNKWYNSNQTVSWTLTDKGSGGLPAPGPAGFTQGWDSIPADPYSEPNGGTGNSFYSGPQYPYATNGCLAFNANGCSGGSGQGCHTVKVEGWDNQGVTAYGSYGPLCYDSVDPTIAVSNSPSIPRSGWYNTAVKVTLSATDPGGSNASGIHQSYYQINYAGCYPGYINYCSFYSAPFTISAQGQYTVTYFTVDNAGNYSGEHSEQVNIDLSSPVTTASLSGTVLSGTTYESAVGIKLGATNAGGSGVAAIYYSLDGGPQATYAGTINVSAVGGHTIKFWSINGAGTTGTAGTLSFSIESPTTSTLTASPNPSVSGQGVTLTAIVAATIPGNAPAGTVTFLNGSASIGVGTLTGGAATLTTSSLAAGSHSLTAHYAGTANFIASTSSAVSDVVLQKTTTALSASSSSAVYGSSVTLTATVKSSISGTPTGTVRFLSGSTLLGSEPLSGGSASISTKTMAEGHDSITAVYSGDPTYATSTSAALAESVTPDATTTKISSSLNPASYGNAVTFTATVTSAVAGEIPSGSVSFLSGSIALGSATLNSSGVAAFTTSKLPEGASSISARYTGVTDFSASSSSVLSQTVTADQTTTKISSSLNPSIYGKAITFTATVTSAVAGEIPSGSVSFLSGSTALGSATLNSSGVATLTTSKLPAGASSISASYGGSTDFSASKSGAISEVVDPAATTTVITSSLNPASYGEAIKFTATVTSAVSGEIPTGSVTFKLGTVSLGTGVLTDGVATLTIAATQVGTGSITAGYTGVTGFSASTSAPLSEVVSADATTTKVSSSLSPSVFGKSVTFTATVTSAVSGTTPSGSVMFMNGSTVLGTVTLSKGVATLTSTTLPVGTDSISAKYTGVTDFSSSTSAAISQVVSPN